ncbi:MAG: hypothetical protein NUV32_09005 [Exilispira sp.]|nr:hypothetical protein [Exilispira sp.]
MFYAILLFSIFLGSLFIQIFGVEGTECRVGYPIVLWLIGYEGC